MRLKVCENRPIARAGYGGLPDVSKQRKKTKKENTLVWVAFRRKMSGGI
jgi:hypothetical protein